VTQSPAWDSSRLYVSLQRLSVKCFTNLPPSVRISPRYHTQGFFGGSTLANIKSQIKRNKQNEKKRVRNRVVRGRTRTFVAKARVALEGGEKATSAAAIKVAVSELDKAAQKGVIHKNNAARRKSRLMKQLSALSK
jgi:small subunit ribosomal protein S20